MPISCMVGMLDTMKHWCYISLRVTSMRLGNKAYWKYYSGTENRLQIYWEHKLLYVFIGANEVVQQKNTTNLKAP